MSDLWAVVVGAAIALIGGIGTQIYSDWRHRKSDATARAEAIELEHLLKLLDAVETLASAGRSIRHALHGVVGRADVEAVYTTKRAEWENALIGFKNASRIVPDSALTRRTMLAAKAIDEATMAQLAAADSGKRLQNSPAADVMSDAHQQLGLVSDQLATRIRELAYPDGWQLDS